MKKRSKLIITLGCGLCATLALGACATLDRTNERLEGQGYTVVITYDKNGGTFAGADNISIVDRYPLEVAEKGIKLIAPGDIARGESLASKSRISRNGYTLAGWYREMKPRVDKDGNPLDENGDPCSAEKQGTMYEGLWDFATEVLDVDAIKSTNEKGKTVYEMTLHAAWIPNFSYALLRQDAEGNWKEFDRVNKPSGTDSIALPAWSAKTGKLEGSFSGYYDFAIGEKDSKGQIPTASFTLDAVYGDAARSEILADSEMTNVVKANIVHGGKIDYTTGTADNVIYPLYTDWTNGKGQRPEAHPADRAKKK